ncbi:probable RNA-dependent RNA polymerase 3 [Panicum virgatum]|uniref:probable RNA-dependent RNA polymerase 3 n=1 Tax=Panicum virgatum TaxID=38727 RepID=UPI0019D68AD2|nr:probable RNA-dependent RNA polymerase 3 [Panicum virgatum]
MMRAYCMFGLVLSKTIKLDVNLSEVHVQIIDDEPCRYESGEIAVQDGESLIHTDGTGLISVDLARECPTSIFKGNFLKTLWIQRDTNISPLNILF